MANRNKLISKEYINTANEIMATFGYEVVSTKAFLGTKYSLIKYNKKDNQIHSNIEKAYSPRFEMPMLFILLISLCIFALATTFLIRFVLKGSDYDKMSEFMSFMLPAFILVIVATICGAWRYFASLKNLKIYNSVNYIKEHVND